MERLWSMSTTIRSADRLAGFLRAARNIEGRVWDHASQEKLQISLIMERVYLSPENKQSLDRLDDRLCGLLCDISHRLTYEEAAEIFHAKNYTDAPMRGRQSLSPLRKLGLVCLDDERRVRFTETGDMLDSGRITLSDFLLESLLKYQYPNPAESGFKNWDTKPFINTLRLIRRVNALCAEQGMKPVGITMLELGIFALSMRRWDMVEQTACKLVEFRRKRSQLKTEELRDAFTSSYIESYLADVCNPQDNVVEYADNMMRYMRLTKYVYIRGGYAETCIDLEPRRFREIDSILAADDGRARAFSPEEWTEYMGRYGTYPRPFETVGALTEILGDIDREIAEIEDRLGITHSVHEYVSDTASLKALIEERRGERTALQSRLTRKQSRESTALADETIAALENIRTYNKRDMKRRFSVELEKWACMALNILDDAERIEGNAAVGDDNEPLFTAPANVPDIECIYDSFNAICEVTMLRSRDQWFNEGQPVMRHLRRFEEQYPGKPCYCLFVAPSIHDDTANTFFYAVKHGYDSRRQAIIPLTIGQMVRVLRAVRGLMARGGSLSHSRLRALYDTCTDLSSIDGYSSWLKHIEISLAAWLCEVEPAA